MTFAGEPQMTVLALTRPLVDFAPFKAFGGLGRFFASIVASQQAAEDFRRLSAQTDAQIGLAGMTRAEAVRQVFDRHFA